MSQKLYEKILLEKESIEKSIISSGKVVSPQSVSELLKIRLAEKKDTLVILCAFYEYMDEKGFAFIKEEPWASYFKTSISKCFTEEKIRLYFSEINENDKLANIINICDDSVKENYYKIIVSKEKENTTEKIKEERLASMPSKVLDRLKAKLRMFNSTFKLEGKEDLKDYSFSVKEIVFDKIAKSPNEVLKDICTYAKTKKELFNSLVNYKSEEFEKMITTLKKQTNTQESLLEQKKVIALGGTLVASKENEKKIGMQIA